MRPRLGIIAESLKSDKSKIRGGKKVGCCNIMHNGTDGIADQVELQYNRAQSNIQPADFRTVVFAAFQLERAFMEIRKENLFVFVLLP